MRWASSAISLISVSDSVRQVTAPRAKPPKSAVLTPSDSTGRAIIGISPILDEGLATQAAYADIEPSPPQRPHRQSPSSAIAQSRCMLGNREASSIIVHLPSYHARSPKPLSAAGLQVCAMPLFAPDLALFAILFGSRSARRAFGSFPRAAPLPHRGIGAKFRLPLPPGEGWGEGSQAGERRLGPASPSPREKEDNRHLPRLNLTPMPIEGKGTTDGRKKPTRSTTAPQRSGSALNPEPCPHSPATIIGAFALKSISFGRRGLRRSGTRSREERGDNRMATDRSGECRRSEAQNASQGEPTGTGQQIHSVNVPLPPGIGAEFRCGRHR